MQQKRINLRPKFVIGTPKKYSEVSTTIINNKFKGIKDDINRDAYNRSQFALKHYRFSDPEGIANFTRDAYDDANKEIEETEKSKKEFLADLRRTTISVAPYAHVRSIPKDLLDKKKFDDSF